MPYNQCHIRYQVQAPIGDMAKDTGTFTVSAAGVYQLGFTALFQADTEGLGAWAEMRVNDKVMSSV